ncbi:MAG: DMT family transporter [Dysgonamonadaceae bacterium]|jgi:transporter family protein|nr:DMT family transporter [Dysgonamonadaceae bacterium]
MWVYLAFASALFLGFYEIAKKASLNGNAVIPVLFLNTVFGSLIFLPLAVCSRFLPEQMQHLPFYIPSASAHTHWLIFIKSLLALSSWIFNYFATKHLPMTLAGPVKATQPVVVLLGALLFFGERLNVYQWLGVLMAVLSFYLLSLTGRKEGINFRRDKWVFFLVLSVLTGATSGLYDKYLLRSMDVMTVQSWFNFYQFAVMLPVLMLLWFPFRKKTTPFHWTWHIPLISIFLAIGDFLYFSALTDSDSMISIVSMIRRSNVLVVFLAGAWIYREKNLKSKAFDLILVLIGMIFLYFGSR